MVRSLTYSRADYRRSFRTIQATHFKLYFNYPVTLANHHTASVFSLYSIPAPDSHRLTAPLRH
jgi:hypothetical protein